MKPPWPVFPNPGFPALELFELSNTIPLTSSPGSLISDSCLHFHVTPVAVPGGQDSRVCSAAEGVSHFLNQDPFSLNSLIVGISSFSLGGAAARGGYNGLVQLLG